MLLSRSTVVLASLFFLAPPAMGATPADPRGIAVIPRPLVVEAGTGRFTVNAQTCIVCPAGNSHARFAAEYLREFFRTASGYTLAIVDPKHTPAKNSIVLSEQERGTDGPESYHISVRPHIVTIVGGGPAGTFYGVQTLLQLLPPSILSRATTGSKTWPIPAVEITDKPRYGWRGMMLDVSRHFFPKEFVKKVIDYLALHKLNTFHWHLTDDQGWRVEIKRYPLLTQLSAWRADREDMHWVVRTEQRPDEPALYGGFYTQEEIREVVAYASERHITVVPEIELPAHVSAVLAAYPEFSCTGGPFTVPTGSIWPITDIYCGGNDSIFTFLEGVFTEVASLFPGKYIHIGGDEADKTEWKRCPKCQARIRSEGLANEAELQSFFVKRVEKILGSLGKSIIGWDEILEGGLAPGAAVMSWRGVKGGIEAAKSGHAVVMAPTSNCYIDYYQGDLRYEPIAIGGYVPLKNVYAYEPTPDTLSSDEAKYILGTQVNLWTEYIPDPAKAEYMIFPRLAAIAEAGWSARERRDWEDFSRRIETQVQRYAAYGINASLSAFNVVPSDTFDADTWTRTVTLTSELGGDGIRYTLDGREPRSDSRRYTHPIVLNAATTLTAATFRNGKRLGEHRTFEFHMTPEEIAEIRLVTSPSGPFDRGRLDDNIRANGRSKDPAWIGVKGGTFEAVADLGAKRAVTQVTIGFFHSSTELIFLPSSVSVSLSDDGERFTEIATATHEVSPKTLKPLTLDFTTRITGGKARFVRVRAMGMESCPDWHKRVGEPVWMLTDELFIE